MLVYATLRKSWIANYIREDTWALTVIRQEGLPDMLSKAFWQSSFDITSLVLPEQFQEWLANSYQSGDKTTDVVKMP